MGVSIADAKLPRIYARAHQNEELRPPNPPHCLHPGCTKALPRTTSRQSPFLSLEKTAVRLPGSNDPRHGNQHRSGAELGGVICSADFVRLNALPLFYRIDRNEARVSFTVFDKGPGT